MSIITLLQGMVMLVCCGTSYSVDSTHLLRQIAFSILQASFGP